MTHGIKLGEDGRPIRPGKDLHHLRFEMPKDMSRATWFCQFIEQSLRPRDRCLVWIVGWGIWASSENWHLYYRLRESYGDVRLIEEAPGHLFLGYEVADLVTLLQIGLFSGRDIHLLPTEGYGRVFVSHDGWAEFSMADPAELEIVRGTLVGASLKALS